MFARTGVPRDATMALGQEIHAYAGRMTSSPSWMSRPTREECNAAVPEVRARAYSDPMYLANSFYNFPVMFRKFGP
jgi:hypothetical protein